MKRILVWDLPVRVLHWVFAGTLTAALVLGFAVDDDHPVFVYHMLFGLIAGFSLVLRLIWGVAGSRPARFSSWAWSPGELVRYVRGVLASDAPRYVSHNPASSWLSAALLGMVALLVLTGIAGGDALEEVHEVLAAAVIGAIAIHLLGMLSHMHRHRENIAWSMVDGYKHGPPETGLTNGRRFIGVVVLLILGAWAGALWRNYDRIAGDVRLPLTAIEIPLGARQDAGESDHHRHRSDD